MVPPVCCTPATVSLNPPKSNVPPAIAKVLALLNRSAAPKAKVPALTVVSPVKVFRPDSVTVPLVVLFKPAEPAKAALTEPACMSKAVVLVKVPLAIMPPVSCTPSTVSLNPPKSKLPPLTTNALVSANRSAAPKARVPALTVVVPMKVLAPDSVSVPLPCLVKPPVPPMAPANVVLFASPAVSVLLPKVTVVPVTPDKEPMVSLAPRVKFAPVVSKITAPVLRIALPPDKASVPALTVVAPS